MNISKTRAWWAHRQGLDGSLDGAAPAAVLARAGWARSVGGANPYLTLFARAGTSRAEAEAAFAARDIYELPSARGCTYILPAGDFALGLTVGQGYGDAATLATAKKYLDVTDEEVGRLCDSLIAALEQGELDPAQLRTQTGDAVRSLGDAGKKRGLATTLPIALGLLQSHGQIRRVPVDGRLDGQRYRYALWRDGFLTATALPLEDAYVDLARRYFDWIAPAKATHFQWFSGLGVRAVKTALASLDLTDFGDGWLMPRELVPEYEAFEAPLEPHYTLVSGLDSIVLLRRDLPSLVERADADLWQMVGERGAGASLGSPDLENHAILDRGRLVGLWEFDPVNKNIAWVSFVSVSPSLEAAIARTEAFIRDDLGDARSFSLDSPSSRAPKLRTLREMARMKVH